MKRTRSGTGTESRCHAPLWSRWAWLATTALAVLMLTVLSGCDDGGGTKDPDTDAGIADGLDDVVDDTARDTRASDVAPDTSVGDTGATDASDTADPQPPWPVTDESVEPIAGCDDTVTPVVFVHGFLGSGDNFATQIQRFSANGVCLSRLFVFDWNSLAMVDHTEDLDAFIDTVLAETGADAVHLAGHSAGGGLAYEYLADPEHAGRVDRYIHIASFAEDAPPGPNGEVPTLNLWSEADTIVDSTTDGGDIPGATNVSFTDLDHFEVATSPEAFEAMYAFLHDGSAPITADIVPTDAPWVGGRVLQLGENTPIGGAWVEIWEVRAEDGARIGNAPVGVFVTDDAGRYGPLPVERDTRYEFRVDTRIPGAEIVHYYREPFVRPNPTAYLRTLPDAGAGVVGLLFGSIRFGDETAVAVAFSASRAVITGREAFTLTAPEVQPEPIDLATPDWASADQTSIAWFFYDVDRDGETSFEQAPTFADFPFLQALDVAIPVATSETIAFELDGRRIAMPVRSPQEEGAAIAVFD